jgi:hypothetical protein
VYFSWSETPPLVQVFRFLLFGQGDVPPVTTRSCGTTNTTRSGDRAVRWLE